MVQTHIVGCECMQDSEVNKMSDLIIKKNGTDYELPMLAEHYPADRVYLHGDTDDDVESAIDILAHSDTITTATSDNGSVSLKATIRGKIVIISATATLANRTAATTITIPGLDMTYTDLWVTNYQGWNPSDQVGTPAIFANNRITLQANQNFDYINIGVVVPLN